MIARGGLERGLVAIRPWAGILVATAVAPGIALACDVCTDNSAPNALREGAEAGVWAMLAIIAFVLLSIAGFGGFFYFRARSIARSARR